MTNKKHERTTCGIANKGFSGIRRFVTRLKVRCNLIGDSPALPYWPYRHPLGNITQQRSDTTDDKKLE